MEENKENSKAKKQKIAKENQEEGKVTWEIYKAYLAAVKNLPFVAGVFILLLVTQVFHSGVSYFISVW